MNKIFLFCAALLAFVPLARADVDSSKPLDLKFTSVDGKPVDLAAMRGKVVLIDFWATWCPPCRKEIPDVVAAYTKYHDKGFSVVGISLDSSRENLLSFIKEHGMVWPQDFEGGSEGNSIAERFGIQQIPAMWLVGKDGKVISMDAREDLGGQVAKALNAS
jgi:thiol-disulfide isomerase/thioredoxin